MASPSIWRRITLRAAIFSPLSLSRSRPLPPSVLSSPTLGTGTVFFLIKTTPGTTDFPHPLRSPSDPRTHLTIRYSFECTRVEFTSRASEPGEIIDSVRISSVQAFSSFRQSFVNRHQALSHTGLCKRGRERRGRAGREGGGKEVRSFELASLSSSFKFGVIVKWKIESRIKNNDRADGYSTP